MEGPASRVDDMVLYMMMRFPILLVVASVLLPGCFAGLDIVSSLSEPCGGPRWSVDGLHGRGASTISQDAADRAARLNLVKQLDIQIIQEDSVVEGEDSGGNFWYRVQSDVVEKINVRISGVTIRDRHFDSSCQQYFALAVLDRDRSVNLLLSDLDVASNDRVLLRERIHQHEADGDVVGLIWALYQLLQVQEKQHALSRNLSIMDPQVCRSNIPCSPQTSETLKTQSQIDDVLSSIHIRMIAGTDQKVACGRGLENSLVVRVGVTIDEQHIVLPGLPMQFVFEEGSGHVDRVVRTDAHGLARAVVHYVEPGEQIAEVVARLQWQNLPDGFPFTLRQRLEQLGAQETARFVMYPPADAVSAGFDSLACRLVTQAVTPRDGFVRVDGFFEKGEKEINAPSVLGQRLQSQMVSALVQTGAVRVLDVEVKENTVATVAVKGMFERDAYGDLWVQATMIDVVDQIVRGVAETHISRKAFQPADLYELHASAAHDVVAKNHHEEIVGNDGAPMALVLAGYFSMGTAHGESDEGPMHQVYVDAYYMDGYEVTTSRYADFLSATERGFPHKWNEINFETDAEKPVIGVSWQDATAYCHWAGKRLPTEAEWEKAARGDDERMYPWGDEMPDARLANFNRRAAAQVYRDVLAPVSSYEAGKSPFGIFNLSGNVWEWVADWYQEDYYARSPDVNPMGPMTGEQKVLRGGSWVDGPQLIRATDRFKFAPSTQTDLIGFRCALDIN